MVCKICGAQLQNEDTFCAACGEDCINKEKEAVKCIECGKFFNKEFGMCPFCGTELAEDNIELTDNQDIPLSVTDTEEAFVEENTEGNFVLCPNCNNKYDINVGLCTICGYSSLETDETVAEEDEASANVSVIEDSTSDKLNTYNSAYSDTEENKPVNYKKIGIISAIVICVIVILSLILSNSLNSNDESKGSSNGILDVFSKEEGVSTEQFESDVAELSYIKNGIVNNNTAGEYQVNEITVEKRQTNIEQKNDIIYCFVNISNELYESDVYVKLTYNLYNGDIWTLDEDEYISEESVSKPLKCVGMSNFPESFDEFYVNGSHEIEVENIQYIKDDNLMPCDVDYYTYKQTSYYKVVSTEGIFGADICIDYYFNPTRGWTQITREYFVKNYEIQKAYCLKPDEIFGDFKRVSLTIGRYQEYLQFYNYNSNDNTISYTYTNESNQKINGTAVFDILNMSISNDEYTFNYETEYEVWHFGSGFWSYDMAYKKMN